MPPKRKRQRTIILLALTALYLVFELSFSAQLLDAAGGDVDMRTIHSLEHWGRTLSGVALALLIWGTLFTMAALRTWRRAVLGLVIAVGASIPSMFSTQYWIVENRIAAMTDSDRRAAVILEMTSGSIRNGDLMIDGLGLSAAELSSPGGKAFVALLPMLTSTLPDVEGQGGSALRTALRLRLGNGAPGPDCLGSFEAFSNITWRRGLAEIGTAYALYADADARFADATGAALAHRQATDWNAYVDRLGRRGWNPRTVPAAMRARVRARRSQRLLRGRRRQGSRRRRHSLWIGLGAGRRIGVAPWLVGRRLFRPPGGAATAHRRHEFGRPGLPPRLRHRAGRGANQDL